MVNIPLRSILNRQKPGVVDSYPLDPTDIKVIFADSQRRQFGLTPLQEAKVREMVKRNPMAGITITMNKLTGEVHIQEAK